MSTRGNSSAKPSPDFGLMNIYLDGRIAALDKERRELQALLRSLQEDQAKLQASLAVAAEGEAQTSQP